MNERKDIMKERNNEIMKKLRKQSHTTRCQALINAKLQLTWECVTTEKYVREK
jgi:hypothetical protein